MGFEKWVPEGYLGLPLAEARALAERKSWDAVSIAQPGQGFAAALVGGRALYLVLDETAKVVRAEATFAD